MTKLPHCPRFIVAGPDFVTVSTGAPVLLTMLSVGSLGAGVRGSSDGWAAMLVALSTPFLETRAPLAIFWSTRPPNVIVPTYAGLLDASAGINPGFVFPGGLIGMPFPSSDTPAASGTAAPFRVVLPGT